MINWNFSKLSRKGVMAERHILWTIFFPQKEREHKKDRIPFLICRVMIFSKKI
jgi:hypothetical protein